MTHPLSHTRNTGEGGPPGTPFRFRAGDHAVVTGTGSCLKQRNHSSLSAPVLGCFLDDTIVGITGLWTDNEGERWWPVIINGVRGFMADRFLKPPPTPPPEPVIPPPPAPQSPPETLQPTPTPAPLSPVMDARADLAAKKAQLKEPGRFDYGILPKYPHLTKNERAVWEKFVNAHPAAYLWVDYDEVVGKGRVEI